MGWPGSVAKKKHALIVDAQALRALNAISKDVLFGVGPVPTENSIMVTHDRGLTTAVAIPSAVLPSVAGKQRNLIQMCNTCNSSAEFSVNRKIVSLIMRPEG